MEQTSRLRVLVVEDNPDLREMLAKFVIYDGHTSVTAADGLEGKEKFLAGEFDVVLVDQAMPKMNGEELSAFIKETKPDQLVIMLTGFYDIMVAEEKKPPTVDLLLGKPLILDDLLAVLAEVRRE